MVRRGKDDGGTAVVERGNPDDIAAKVAAADAEARRAAVVADIEEFRGIVRRIADGIEPDGAALAAIGDLSRRLRLPPDALSQAVKAVQADNRNTAAMNQSLERIETIQRRQPELERELAEADERLRQLQHELREFHNVHNGYPWVLQAQAETREANPLMFAPADVVATRLVAAGTGLSTATLKGMVREG